MAVDRRAVMLVTGGAGFIGSALVRELSRHGPVRILDDLSTGRSENVEALEGAELRVASVLDRAEVESALDGVGIVFHLACRGVRHSIHDPVENHRVNAEGTLTVLEAARAHGVERFVHVSSSEVYGDTITAPMDELHPTLPHTVYGAAKLAGEAYARAYHRTYGLATVVVRPFNSFGPRSHHEGDSGEVIPRFLVRAMNDLPLPVFGDGEQTRDFTFVDDTARGIALAGEIDDAVGRTINLGSGREHSINEVAEAVKRATRRHVAADHLAPRPGDVRRLIADSGLAGRVLGWSPKIQLDEGIRALLDWHQRRGTDWAEALSQEVERNWEPAPR